MDTLTSLLWSMVSWAWWVLGMLFALPLIGPLLQIIFLVLVGWFLYRYTPQPLRFVAVRLHGILWPYIGPTLSAVTAGVRRAVVRLLADPGMLHNGAERIVYRDRPQVRGSWRRALFLRVRWAILGVLSWEYADDVYSMLMAWWV